VLFATPRIRSPTFAATAAAKLRERRSELRSVGDEGAPARTATRAAAASPPPLFATSLRASHRTAGRCWLLRDMLFLIRPPALGTPPRRQASAAGGSSRCGSATDSSP
jgi:hypothetical protein